MRILNIMQCTNLGGMEQASLRLMLSLQERGHSFEVISLNPIGKLGPLLKGNNISASGLTQLGKGGWRSFLALRKTLQEADADALIMTGHHLLTMLALNDLCRGKRLLAIHFHHAGVKPAWQWRLIYRVAYKRFQSITFPSKFVQKEAEEIYPPIKPFSHLVRNPLATQQIPSTEVRAKARASLGLPSAGPIIGNAGWLIPRKRFDVFLHVAAKVLRQIPDAFFVIAGDGEERSRLEALAGQLGISQRVKWLGWQQDLIPFYHSLDILLFNSDWDAMGLSPLEGTTYGVPLVASVLNGGLQEIITSPEYGYLNQNHDIDALAAQTISYLQNPQEMRRVGLAGRDRVAQISSPTEHAAQVEALLLGEESINESSCLSKVVGGNEQC